jgi:hypothetical protein
MSHVHLPYGGVHSALVILIIRYGKCFYSLGCTERISVIIFVGLRILPSGPLSGLALFCMVFHRFHQPDSLLSQVKMVPKHQQSGPFTHLFLVGTHSMHTFVFFRLMRHPIYRWLVERAIGYQR